MVFSETIDVGDRVLVSLVHVALCCTLSLRVCAQEVNITPSDPAVCTGADVTFRCSMDNMAKQKQIQMMTIPELLQVDTYLDVINEHTAELTLYNVTSKHDNLLVCCAYSGKDCDIYYASTLNVYPLPEKVQNFSCLVENYKSMACSWNYGKTYDPFKKPEVTLHWRMLNDTSWKECSNLNKVNGNCYWSSSQAEHFILEKMQIRLTLSQTCGVSVVSDFQIDTSKIVKPDPVVDLSSTVLNSTCILIVWSSTVNRYQKEHRVIVSSKWRDDKELRFTSTADNKTRQQSKTFCNLHPYTYYKFTVSTQPTGQQAGNFSDPRVEEALTYSDKPSSSPKVTNGGYHWHRMDCEGTSNTRRVCIFWKPLKEEEKNGYINGLQVTFTAVQRNVTIFQDDWSGDLTYGCVNSLLCNTSYTFTIKAENINGTSEQGSSLYISSANSGIPQQTFIVESNNNSQIYVSLANAEAINAYGFIVAWCHNHNGGCKRDHEVQWERFPWNTREVVIQTDPAKSPQEFLYGVSVLTEQGSSGLEWQDCVYMKNIEPKREIRNVAVSAGLEDNSLVVTWDKLTCKSDEPYIAMYNVQYNKKGDEYHKSQNVTASDEARLVLQDLEEDQTYEVTVRGITKYGRFGKESEPKTGTPLNKSLKTGLIVLISMIALLCVVLSGIGCYCVISGCKKKAKYTLDAAAKITIPCLNNNDDDKPSDCTSVDYNASYTYTDTNDQNIAANRLRNSYVATVLNGITKEKSANYLPNDTGLSVTRGNGIIEEGRVNYLPNDTGLSVTPGNGNIEEGRVNYLPNDTGLSVTRGNVIIEEGRVNYLPNDTGLGVTPGNGIIEDGRVNYLPNDTAPNFYCSATVCYTNTDRRPDSSSHQIGPDSYYFAAACEGVSEEGQANCFHHDTGFDGIAVNGEGAYSSPLITGLESYNVAAGCVGISEEGQPSWFHHDTGLDDNVIHEEGTFSSPHSAEPDSYHFAAACGGISEEGQANCYPNATEVDSYCSAAKC